MMAGLSGRAWNFDELFQTVLAAERFTAMIENHGAYWQIEPGWRVIHQRYDAPTGLLAVIMKHDGRELIKADLFIRFDAGERPVPRWEPVGCIEAVFGPNDVHEAATYLEAAIRNRTNDGQPPAPHV